MAEWQPDPPPTSSQCAALWAQAAGDKGEEGVDRGFERTGAPLHLGEEQPSLERGEQRSGEVVRVDVGRELSVGMEGSESVAEGGCPLVEPGGDGRAASGSVSAS